MLTVMERSRDICLQVYTEGPFDAEAEAEQLLKRNAAALAPLSFAVLVTHHAAAAAAAAAAVEVYVHHAASCLMSTQKGLLSWRDQVARQRDVSHHAVLPNACILLLSQRVRRHHTMHQQQLLLPLLLHWSYTCCCCYVSCSNGCCIGTCRLSYGSGCSIPVSTDSCCWCCSCCCCCCCCCRDHWTTCSCAMPSAPRRRLYGATERRSLRPFRWVSPLNLVSLVSSLQKRAPVSASAAAGADVG